MYQSGNVHQVAKEMWRLNLMILEITEAKRLGSDKIQLVTGKTLFYSGATGDSAPHENRVALTLSKRPRALSSGNQFPSVWLWQGLNLNSRKVQSYKYMHQQDEKVEFYNQPQAEFNKVKKKTSPWLWEILMLRYLVVGQPRSRAHNWFLGSIYHQREWWTILWFLCNQYTCHRQDNPLT